MSTGALDPLIHDPERLRIVATLAALPDGDALSGTRLQDVPIREKTLWTLGFFIKPAAARRDVRSAILIGNAGMRHHSPL